MLWYKCNILLRVFIRKYIFHILLMNMRTVSDPWYMRDSLKLLPNESQFVVFYWSHFPSRKKQFWFDVDVEVHTQSSEGHEFFCEQNEWFRVIQVWKIYYSSIYQKHCYEQMTYRMFFFVSKKLEILLKNPGSI